jgi:hypothetical protein
MPGSPKKALRRKQWAAKIETKEFWEKFFLHLASGGSIAEFAMLEDIGYNWLLENAKGDGRWDQAYTRAREARANFHATRIDRMADEVEQGVLDPQAARVAGDFRKWLASRQDPKQWGDKIQAEVKTLDVTQLHLEALRRTIDGTAETVEEGDQAYLS